MNYCYVHPFGLLYLLLFCCALGLSLGLMGCQKEPREDLGALSPNTYFYPEAGPVGTTITLLGQHFSSVLDHNHVV